MKDEIEAGVEDVVVLVVVVEAEAVEEEAVEEDEVEAGVEDSEVRVRVRCRCGRWKRRSSSSRSSKRRMGRGFRTFWVDGWMWMAVSAEGGMNVAVRGAATGARAGGRGGLVVGAGAEVVKRGARRGSWGAWRPRRELCRASPLFVSATTHTSSAPWMACSGGGCGCG
jgi:hypothetical protein